VTQKQTQAESVKSVGEVASAMFGAGFFVGDELREELRVEAALKLAYALREAGVHRDSVHALALAVRDVGDAAALMDQDKEKLTEEQRKMLQGVITEKGLPAPFRTVLEAALPRLVQRRDLVVLYGVLSSTYERMGRIEAVKALPIDAPIPKKN
jgi:hypothetical protein